MGTATIRVYINADPAKRGIKELGKELDNLNKKRAPRPKNGGPAGEEGSASTPGKKPGTPLVTASGSVSGVNTASPLTGFGKEILKVTGALGALNLAVESIKNIDGLKNWFNEIQSGIKGLVNPGEGADASIDEVGRLADKGRQYRMSAQDTSATIEAMKTTYGTDKGEAMLEKVDTYVSEALVMGGEKLKQLMRDFNLDETQVDSMEGMNARERFEYIMQSASSLKTPDEAASALVPVLGAKNVGEAKGNIAEYANFRDNYARYMSMSSSALSPENVKRLEGWGDQLDYQRYATRMAGFEVSDYQADAARRNELSRTAAAVNFNAKSDDRGWLFGGASDAAAYYQNNIDKPLNRQDFQQGISTLANAIKSGPTQPATNDKSGANFQ